MNRRLLVLAGAVVLGHIACAPPPPKLPDAPVISERQKLAWILQLEDQRLLRIDLPAPPPPPAEKGRTAAPKPAPPSSSPDLSVLVKDAEPRIRRRAALAIGRVKDRAGIALLTPVLADPDPDVRAMAAFGLGLIGDPSAEAALTPLLDDPVPLVRGRAAEALGQVGAKGAATAIGKMAAEYRRHPSVTALQPDDESWPALPEAEAFKLGLFALVRLGAYDAIAAAALDGSEPVTEWWPVAYALQRVEDPRAAPALIRLLNAKGRYSPAFAARGLGRLKHAPAAKPLLALLDPAAKSGLEVTVSAIRALAHVGGADAVPALVRVAAEARTNANLRLEAVVALGELRHADGLATVQDLMTDDWPAMRAAALRAAAAIDPDSFVTVLAGMEPDRHWRVRAALADVLSSLPVEVVGARLRSMLNDDDKRVIPAVIASLAKIKATDIQSIATARLGDSDPAVREAAINALAGIKAPGVVEALRQAYQAAQADTAYDVRATALRALAEHAPGEAMPTLKEALTDKEWAVRVRAQELLAKVDPNAAPASIAPVPHATGPYDTPELVTPELSPHVFIEVEHGTIEFELAVLDAPLTSRNFVELVKKGFFNGLEVHRVVPNFVVQDGDPRGDGTGGPGYTIRDELNERPYLRGTVGMALQWRDTGGSQFFIAHSPQPHLDARYTAFGRVVNGMDVVDRIRAGDRILRVRVWDGTKWQN